MKLSFKARLLAGFVVAAYIPFILLLIYVDYTSRQLLVTKIATRQSAMLENIRQGIEIDIEQLQRESRFIASLSIMNDLIVSDVDKRIQKLLEQKQSTLKLDVRLWVSDASQRCIAATDGCDMVDDALLIESPIISDYGGLMIGRLVIAIPYSEFRDYFPHQSDAQWFVTKGGDRVATSHQKLVHSDEDIPIYQPFLLSLLDSFDLHVVIQRAAVMESFVEVRNKTYLFALLGLLLIIAMAYYLSHYFSRPLNTMSKLMHTIVRDGSYELRSNIVRGDEIGTLSQNIDALLQTTENLLEALGDESKLRLKRFISLIETFNAITRSNSEGEIDHWVKRCLSDEFFEKEPEYYELFIEAVGRMAKLQKERLLLQKTQLRLLEETSSALKAKSEFISQISHEFRTPLNSIIGFSQFMDQEKLLQDPYEHLPRNVEKAGKYLLEMINQLLELAKRESMPVQVEMKAVDLVHLCQEVMEIAEPLAVKNRTQLHYEGPVEAFEVETDERMMRQVLFNLIGNAIKFSPEASVTLIIRHEKGFAQIVVQDTGIGMEPEEMKGIFAPFQRLSNSQEFKGTGLGLSLAKAYVENFGGTITASSEGVGKGSTFKVTVKTL